MYWSEYPKSDEEMIKNDWLDIEDESDSEEFEDDEVIGEESWDWDDE